ncbi:hypothetical protein L596_002374 [Steinernema carpocapsae]|uniref:Uncharacterized protein n=1 Tax=Steinernema carpocapsae TaxID=34508 RepID=A0A4U8URS4_STECR|nr:hypothetical protein L596_002374 [Steinernema carpocapsae]
MQRPRCKSLQLASAIIGRSFSRRAGDGYFRQKTAERPYDPSGKIHRLGIMQLLEMPTDESERSNEGPQSFPSEKSSSSNAKATSKGEPQQRGQQSEEPGGSQKTTKCPPDASAQSSAIGAQSSVITQLLGIPVDESERSHDEHRSVAADGALRMPCLSNAETTSLKLLSGEVQQQERLSGQPSRSHETDMTPSRSFRSTSVVVDSTILSAPQVIPEAIKSPEVMEVDDDSDRGSPDLYIIEESSYTPSAQRDTRKRPRTINASQESSVSAPARPESPEIEILCVVTPGSGVPPARPRNSDSRNSSGRSSMGDLELNELREQLLAARKPEKESELMEEPNSIQLLAAPDIEKKSAPTEEPETTESLKPENCSALLPPEVSPEGIPTELSESAHDTSHDEDALRLAALQSILAKRSQKLTKRPPSVSEAPLQSCEASEPKRKVSPSVFATLGYSSQPSNREEPIRKTLQDAPKWGQKSSTPERSLVIRPDRPRSSPHTASNYKRRRNVHPSTHFELSEDSVVRYTSSGTAYRTVTPKKPPKKRPLIELEEGEILEDISDEETGEEGTNEGLPSFDDLDLELMEEVFSDSEEKDSAALEEGEIESIGSSSDQESTLEPEDRLEADRPRSLDFSPAESRPSSRLTRPVSQLSAQGESRLSSFGRRSSLEKDNRKKRPFRYEVYFSPQASRSPPELARPVSQMSRRSDRLGFSLDHESFFGRENPREERRPQSCDFSALATRPSALTRPVSQASFRNEASLGFSSGRRRSRETERRPKEGRFQLSDYLTWTSRPSFELMRPFSQVSGRLDFFSDQEDSFRKEHRREERTFPPFDCSVMTSRPPTEPTRTVSQMSVQSEVRLISISNQECSIGMEDQPNERRKQLSGHFPVTSRSLSGPATLTFDQNSACLSSSSGRENLTGAGNQPKEGGQQPFDLSAITSGPSAEPSRSVSQVSVRSADHLGPFADSSSNQETFAGTEDQSKENRSPLCRYLPQTSHASAELPAPTSNTAAPSEAPMNSSSKHKINSQNLLHNHPTVLHRRVALLQRFPNPLPR